MRFLISVFVLLVSVSVTATAAIQCKELATALVTETVVRDAGIVSDHPGIPGFCHVEGKILQRIGFVMRMPVSDWNGKFAVAGCGGFCGSLRPDKPGYSNSMLMALRSGYAVIQTDSGHQAESWDTDWAIGDETALKLFAGEWMPHTVATGRGLIEAYYGDSPSRSYFSGCSNGGRLGMYAAQRYPEYFDGIAAGGGIFDLTGNSGLHGMWVLQTTRDQDGKAVIDRAKIPMLAAYVAGRCDALDGVEDGVVARPEQCKPDVAALQCAGDEAPDCFTAAEVTAIEKLYQGASVNGQQLFAGVPPGSESLWPIWLVGTDDDWAWGERASLGNLRLTYGIPSDQHFNAYDYVLADEIENIHRYSTVLDAVDPDLSSLEKEGGKLFYWHGLADPLILEGRARQYQEESVSLMGKARFDAVARFVMVPGHGHCWEKPGQVADDFDPLAVIDRWVESGEAPDEVVAKLVTADSEKGQTRKLCAYPKVAEFVSGDTDDAANFVCR